jgi:hypothetical protein
MFGFPCELRLDAPLDKIVLHPNVFMKLAESNDKMRLLYPTKYLHDENERREIGVNSWSEILAIMRADPLTQTALIGHLVAERDELIAIVLEESERD